AVGRGELVIGAVRRVGAAGVVIAPVGVLDGGVDPLADTLAGQAAGHATHGRADDGAHRSAHGSAEGRAGHRAAGGADAGADRMRAWSAGDRVGVQVVADLVIELSRGRSARVGVLFVFHGCGLLDVVEQRFRPTTRIGVAKVGPTSGGAEG